jgi:hypothetical protein
LRFILTYRVFSASPIRSQENLTYGAEDPRHATTSIHDGVGLPPFPASQTATFGTFTGPQIQVVNIRGKIDETLPVSFVAEDNLHMLVTRTS